MTPARYMRNPQLLPKIAINYVCTAWGTETENVYGSEQCVCFVKESAYLTLLSPGVGWLAYTD